MAREIGFRAWDKMRREMFDSAIYNAPDSFDMILKLPQFYTVMQYTGLKDKNDKKVYESDRVRFTVFDYNGLDTQHRGVIKWSGTRFVICSDAEHGYFGADGPFDLDWVFAQDDESEVVGNIYEGGITNE